MIPCQQVLTRYLLQPRDDRLCPQVILFLVTEQKRRRQARVVFEDLIHDCNAPVGNGESIVLLRGCHVQVHHNNAVVGRRDIEKDVDLHFNRGVSVEARRDHRVLGLKKGAMRW